MDPQPRMGSRLNEKHADWSQNPESGGQKKISSANTINTGLRGYRLKTVGDLKYRYRRFADYVVDHHPTLGRIGLFGAWGLREIRQHFLWLGLLPSILVVTLLALGIYWTQYRWPLSFGAIAVLLMVGAGLGISYVQYLFKSFRENQREEIQSYNALAINQIRVRFENDMRQAASKSEVEAMMHLLHERQEKVQKTCETIRQEMHCFKEEIRQAFASHADAISKSGAGNQALYQPFNRFLAPDIRQQLEQVWLPLLCLEHLKAKSLGYLAHRICQVESACIGHLASSVEDALLRVLVALSIKSEKLTVLKIGSLYGVELICLYDSCRGRFSQVQIIAVDPLDGSGTTPYDPATAMSMHEDIIAHNLQLMNIPDADVLLIKGDPAAKAAVEAAGAYQFDVLIVGGDQGQKNISKHLENYRPMLKPGGGYILIEDYHDQEFQDTIPFVDDHGVQKISKLQHIGSDWRTTVFRSI